MEDGEEGEGKGCVGQDCPPPDEEFVGGGGSSGPSKTLALACVTARTTLAEARVDVGSRLLA